MAVPQRRNYPSSENGSDTPRSRSQLTDMSSSNNDPMSLAVLPPISEFGGMDGRDSSLPSSYRRLRKTRSMFTTGPRFSRRSTGILSHSYVSPARDGLSPSEVPRTTGALRRSWSFFRGDQGASRTLDYATSHDAAIQMARNQFQRQSISDMSQYSQSSILPGRPKREHKPFRKTFRNLSTAESDLASTPSPRSSFNNGFPHARTRSFSSSIKRGIKRVLGLSKPVETHKSVHGSPSSSSTQHADSSPIKPTTKGHFPNENAQPYPGMREWTSPSGCRPATIRSARSIDSFATTHSRVTSWADSSAANTVSTVKGGDRGSLSFVNEKAALNRRFEPTTLTSAATSDGSVDSRRLYAALMKRIRGHSANGSAEEIVFGRVKEHRAIPTRASSLHPRCSRQTIRHIPSGESVTSPKSFATARGDTTTPQVSVPQRPHDRILSQDLEYLHTSERVSTDSQAGFYGVTGSPEDDSSSMVLAAMQSRGSASESSSVYSRTTSGNTPTIKDQRVNPHAPAPEDEPGVATIYATQRSAYSSPNRASVSPRREPSARPSADWQQWMKCQMERIEDLDLPARRDHYREDAQIYGDDNVSPREGRMRDPEGSLARQDDSTRPAHNYSRPFSRSSSVRTILSVTKEQAGSMIVPSPSSIPILQKPPGGTPEKTFSPTRGRKRDSNPMSAPMQLRPSNRIRYSISPTPKRDASEFQQRMVGGGINDRYQLKRSPVPHDSKTLCVRSTRSRRDGGRVTNENLKAEQEQGDFKNTLRQSPGMGSPISSKRMVELFLNSRRQQMGTGMSDEDTTSEGAFV